MFYKQFLNIFFILFISIFELIQSQIIFSPYESSSIEFKTLLNSGIIHDNHAYVSASAGGIYAYNIQETNEPQLVSQHKLAEGATTLQVILIDISGNKYLLASSGINGICLHKTKTLDKISCAPFEYTVQSAIQFKNDYIITVGQGKYSLLSIQQTNNEINFLILKTWATQSTSTNKVKVDNLNKFVFISNESKGLGIIDGQKLIDGDPNPLIIEKIYFELTFDMVIPNDNQYIYVIDFFRGLFITDINPLYNQLNVVSGDLIDTELLVTQSLPNSIEISNDNNYLFIGIRTYGIQIYDITNRLEIKLLETLDTPGYAYSISFSQDEKQLLFCNGYYMKIFEQLQPNFNKNFPNIFNQLQSFYVSLERQVTIGGQTFFMKNTGSPWSIEIDKTNRYLFIAGARSGSQIWDVSDPQDPQFKFAVDINNLQNPADAIQITDTHMYIGEGWGGIKIYDIQDMNNIFQVGGTTLLNGDSDSIQITKDDNYMIVGNGGTGVSLVDIKDKSIPNEIGVWQNNKPGGSVENVLLNKENTLVFTSVRYYGLVILDIQDKTINPQEISEYYTGMCESVQLSIDEKYAFLSDGTLGITILNVTQTNTPLFLQSVSIGGFPTKMQVTQYDDFQFLIVATRDKELISVLNITDITQPSLFSKYDEQSEQAYDLVISTDKAQMYILTNFGLRILPMISPINVHTEFIEINEDGSKGNSVQDSLLKIGKSYRLLFVPIGIGRPISVDKIYYYSNFIIGEQPNWMAFDSLTQSLSVDVDKKSLQEGWQMQNNFIFISLLIQIFPDDFLPLQTSGKITDAQNAWDDLKKAGYIDNKNMLTSNYQINQDLFNLDGTLYNLNQRTLLSNKMAQFIYQIPIRFTVANSLFFENDYQKFKQTLNQQMEDQSSGFRQALSAIILSVSDYLVLEITIEDNKKAEFVDKIFIGSLVILSDSLDHITIEGPKELALQTLVEDLRIQNYTENLEEIQITFIIDDRINYVQRYQDNLSQFEFIQLHEGVSVDQNFLLQFQFERVFEYAQIEIDEDFTFQFSEQTFISPAGRKLTYTFQIENPVDSDEYTELPQDYWLVSNPPDRRISGTPAPSQIYTKQKVKIIASDDYSQASDILEIKIWNFTFIYIVLQAMEIGGPILGILGIWEYKYMIYGILFKGQYTYSADTAYVGEKFIKTIPLMQDNLTKGKYLFKRLDFKLKQNVYWTKYGDFNKEKLITFIKEESNAFNMDLIKRDIDIEELDNKESRLYRVVIGLGALYILQNHHQYSLKAFKVLKEYGTAKLTKKDWYKNFLNIDFTDYSVENSSVFPKMYVFDGILKQFLESQKLIKLDQIQQMAKNKKNKNKIDQELAFYDRYNMYLLKECIYAEAMGITLYPIIFPSLSKGMVIHCEEYNLDAVQGYQKVSEPSCCNDGYETCGLSTNQPLPSWLLVEVRNGCIMMSGIPRNLDQGELKLKIYLDGTCLVRQFVINVVSYEMNIKNIQKEQIALKNIGINYEKEIIYNQNQDREKEGKLFNTDIEKINTSGNQIIGLQYLSKQPQNIHFPQQLSTERKRRSKVEQQSPKKKRKKKIQNQYKNNVQNTDISNNLDLSDSQSQSKSAIQQTDKSLQLQKQQALSPNQNKQIILETQDNSFQLLQKPTINDQNLDAIN